MTKLNNNFPMFRMVEVILRLIERNEVTPDELSWLGIELWMFKSGPVEILLRQDDLFIDLKDNCVISKDYLQSKVSSAAGAKVTKYVRVK